MCTSPAATKNQGPNWLEKQFWHAFFFHVFTRIWPNPRSHIFSAHSVLIYGAHRLNTAKLERSMMPSLMSQIEPAKILK
jgi:hypothetical protein